MTFANEWKEGKMYLKEEKYMQQNMAKSSNPVCGPLIHNKL